MLLGPSTDLAFTTSSEDREKRERLFWLQNINEQKPDNTVNKIDIGEAELASCLSVWLPKRVRT